MLQNDNTENKILPLHEVAELEFKQAKAGIQKRIKFCAFCYNSSRNNQERIWVLCKSTSGIPDPFQSCSKPTRLDGLHFDLGQGLKVLVYLKTYISEHVLYNVNWWRLSSHFYNLRRWSCFIACAKQSRCSEDLSRLSVLTEMAYFAVLCFCRTEGGSLIWCLWCTVCYRV